MNVQMETANRRRRVGTAIPLREAAERVQLPPEEIVPLIRKGLVFFWDGMVSIEALPLIQRRRAELLSVSTGRTA